MNGSFPLAIVGGAIAAVIGAAIWAAVSLATGYQIGFMAIGVGLLVGIAVRFAGGGGSPAFGVIGGLFALLGCLLGNLLTVIGYLADHEGIGFFAALFSFNYAATFEIMQATFSPMDLLFYGIAVYEGFKFGMADGE